ncbi:MAG TPA: LON peptidase substrate-binding domain-containing protein [Blastocatellia bacterium]|jgi:Lon protease-like protein|nr:LON peptidase substrate-binding domain-containing protein [Blastocatellia bacterium]
MELEGLERLEELPIFPLATVLFPGAVMPLHIFEERYKQMIRFATDNGDLFGLSYRADAQVDVDTFLDPGSVGCLARISASMPLEEGRINLIAIGVVRYRILEIKQLVPFLLARVEPFRDDTERDSGVEELFTEIRGLCVRFLVVAGILDESGDPLDKNLPEEAEAFSLLLSSLLPIENGAKQALLEITSTRLRLTRLKSHVVTAIADYNNHQMMQERAKGNGKGNLK